MSNDNFDDDDYPEDTYDSTPYEVYEDKDSDRPIDQIYCKECGRPIIIWADIELKESDLTCGRCKRGLAPE